MCRVCGPSHVPSRLGACIPKEDANDNCAFSTADGCLLCAEGHYLSNNSCIKATIEHCVFYYDQTCIGCAPGFQLVDRHYSISYFRLVAVPNRFGSFFSNSAYCEESRQPCLAFNTDDHRKSGECVSCITGYHLTVDFQCIKLLAPVLRCETHNTDGSCALCSPETIPDNGQCI